MLKTFAVVAALTYTAAAANAPIREVTSQAIESSGTLVPGFYKGYIYWAGRDNPLTIYSPDGLPGPYALTPNGTAEAIAVDTNGTLAVAWHSKSGGGIDLHDASGALVRTIQTGRYRPTHLSFAEDHSLWSLGWQTRANNPHRAYAADYAIVRRFLPDGQQIGAYLPRSVFPPGLEPGLVSWQWSNCITVSHDRVGLWVYSGMDSTKSEWVELDLNGNLTGRWRLDRFYDPDLRVALTSDGHVFVQRANPDPHRAVSYSLLTLDRTSSTWQTVQSAPGGRLASADGDALIFEENRSRPMHMSWYQHP